MVISFYSLIEYDHPTKSMRIISFSDFGVTLLTSQVVDGVCNIWILNRVVVINLWVL